MSNIFPTLRLAIRALLRRPGFSLTTILTLALGIGANTAIFSVINAVVLRPLAVPEPESLARVFMGSDGSPFGNMSYPDFQKLTEQNDTLAGMYASLSIRANLETGDSLDTIPGQLISEDYFSVLRLRPLLGRLHAVKESEVVLAHGFWRRVSGANPDVVGTSLDLNGHSFVVVGVAPEGFHGVELSQTTDVWLSLQDLERFRPGFRGALDRAHWQLFSSLLAVLASPADHHPFCFARSLTPSLPFFPS